jgi:Leucine-rich repeat (LRR) protein
LGDRTACDLDGDIISLTPAHTTQANNQIRGTIPTEWQALSNMEGFFLGNNELTDYIPSWLWKFTNAIYINFSSNNMKGSVPNFFGNLTELLGLALDRNLLTSIGDVFDSSLTTGPRNLEQLFLEDNQFTGILNENFLGDSCGNLITSDKSLP